MKRLFPVGLIILFFLACLKDRNPLVPDESTGIALYLLKDTGITIGEALNTPVDSLDLQLFPWLSSDDISIYDYSTHFVYLKRDKSNYFNRIYDDHETGLLPFVWTANNQRIFTGAVYTVSMSFVPPCPVINSVDPFGTFLPADVFCLVHPLIRPGKENILNDERIRTALMESMVYHAGISVQLDTVFIVENSDTSTIRYTFTVRNHDQDSLYLPDPDVMGSDRFHYYSGDFIFRNASNEAIWPDSEWDPSLYSMGEWDPAWFTRLPSQDCLTRSVTVRGYPEFQEHVYTCHFQFGGIFRIEKEARLCSDGRYWMGHVSAAVKTVNLSH